jgi:serine/threonine protein phosphatase 1
MKTFIISDIHGEITQLKNILNKIDYNDNMMIILLGDIIDRGENSFETYKYIRRLKDKNNNFILLRGNHEQMMIDSLLDKKVNNGLYNKEDAMIIWQQNGGAKTIRDFKNNRELLVEAAKWFDNLPYIYETNKYIFVHAGIDPEKRLYEQNKNDFLWIRNKFIKAKKFKTNKIIIAGHTPFDKPQVLGNRIILDTGAGKGGYLTVMNLNEGKFI